MNLDASVVTAANAIKSHWLTPPNTTTPARLPWSGWKIDPKDRPNLFFYEVEKAVTEARQPNACKTGPGVEAYAKYDYQAWFNYFYREAKQVSQGSDTFKLAAGQIFSLIFDLKVTGNGNGAKIGPTHALPSPLSAAFASRLTNTGDPVPGHILEFLFKTGFQQATTTNAGSYLDKMLALHTNMNDGVAIRSRTDSFVFGYRGDSREIQTIKTQNGASCRADLDFWRRESHLDAHWHPWQGAQDWANMWFRRGSADNDYFTMNSIAKEFHIACAYPMFKAYEISQKLTGPADSWTDKQKQLIEAKKFKLRKVKHKASGKEMLVPQDETRIFVCAFTSGRTAAKTYELANYPETAVRNVSLEDMIAYITVQRFHHFQTGSTFYESTSAQPSMTIRVKSWSWFREEEQIRAYLGCTQDGMKVISAKMNNLMSKMFDIDHNTYRGNATLDVTIPQTSPFAPQSTQKPDVKRVQLTGW
jgi:hypothetical protein